MHCWKDLATQATLLLLVTASDAFVAPHAARGGTSPPLLMQFRDDVELQPLVRRSAAALVRGVLLGTGAAAFLALGGAEEAKAAALSLHPPPQQLQVAHSVAISSLAPPQRLTWTSSTSNLELADNAVNAQAASSSLASSSPTMLLSATSTNLVGGTEAVAIADLNYDGKVPRTEADEYVVVKNGSKSPVDISGYYLYVATTGTQGPTFYFPANTVVKPGATVRVYTNEVHKETGGYSYGSGKALWSNNGGLAVLRDAKGKKVSEYKYKATT